MDRLNRLFGATKTCHIRGSNTVATSVRTKCRAGRVEY
jgi:hypothetical protein